MPTRIPVKCSECEQRDTCDNKKMIACAHIEGSSIAAATGTSSTMPLMQDMMVKHDYRDIHIDGMNIPIDLEELKKQLVREQMREIMGGCMLNYAT